MSENGVVPQENGIEVNNSATNTLPSNADNGTRPRIRSDGISQRIRSDAMSQRRHDVPITLKKQESFDSGRKSVESTWKKNVDEMKEDISKKDACDWVGTFFPAAKWIRRYKVKQFLFQDVMAGLTVGCMAIPQSMSYAKLAGLPVEYGLYSMFFPVYAYALFGTSRQLAVGPVAILSLTLSAGLSILVDPNGVGIEGNDELQAQYNKLAIQTSLLVGIICIALGVLRLGFITIFLSHAVTSGFTSGAAIIIALNQAKYILGYDVGRSDHLYELLHDIFAHINEFDWRVFLMGFSSILTLLAMKHIGKTYPKFKWVRYAGPLFVTAITIIVTYVAKLDQKGIPTVGHIPSGMPAVTISEWAPFDSRIVATAITCVVVGFMESVAIAKQLASIHGYEIDASMELVGLGVADFVGAIFQSYPVTGSFSRSAVNNECGAESGISAIVTATMVGVILLFLTPVFEIMPTSVLASIIISGVAGLVDYSEAIHLYKVHKFDFLVWCISFLGTMFLGVEIGIGIAVCISLLLVLYESAYPHMAVLGRLNGTTIYRNIKQYPDAEMYDSMVLCRIDSPIYFANAQYVRDKINKYVKNAEKKSEDKVKYIIVDMSPVSHVDTTAMHILNDLYKDCKSKEKQLCFCNPSVRVMEKLRLDGFIDTVGPSSFFVSVHDAVDSCLIQLEEGTVTVDAALDEC